MSAASHLRVIEFDGDTGELHEPDCADCLRKNDEIAGLERDIRGWAARYAELKRDRDRDAREHPLWPVGRALFGEWRALCRHPRSPWTPERFWLIEPFLSNPKYGAALAARVLLCRRAVAGAMFDCYVTTRRNGTQKRHDDWELIYRSAGKWEEFCCRAPRGWEPSSAIEAGESWTFEDVERAMRDAR